MIGPVDFDPYRSEIRDCCCATCREVAYALSDILDLRGARHLLAAEALLAALRDGQHEHVSLQARAAEARVDKAARLKAARAEGASPAALAAIERGYAKVSMRDFFATGMGLGIGPRHGQ